ncbi:intraflagellar transport complex B protein 46 C terminal-domain-containing protein [Globomyces pollinis-pini]|nr:intraflagellar transport complex B protein 46 C terminal-domain-containing protein [Globomyces pollinis-pini]KAJ2998081.1 Intraflagellar transport protein 46 [Globomyces sp. JEL0801]
MLSSSKKSPQPTKVTNNFFDEAMELSESDEDQELDTNYSQQLLDINRGDSPPSAKLSISEDGYEEDVIEKEITKNRLNTTRQPINNEPEKSIARDLKINHQFNGQDEDEEVEESQFHTTKDVEDDLKQLMEYILQYSPQDHELNPELRPFIPDFIPCIGDIDAFIKIPKIDNDTDLIGLAILDEPAASQSDPSVLDLHLRALSKATTVLPTVVRSLDSTLLSKDAKPIDGWIHSIRELHNKKPLPSVNYSHSMPDIEHLMQVWPPEIETALEQNEEDILPKPEMELPLTKYIELLSILLDIPIFNGGKDKLATKKSNSLIESIHVIFTLYSEFKNSDHFKAMDRSNTRPVNTIQ